MKLNPYYSGSAFAAFVLLSIACQASVKLPDSHVKGWILRGNDLKDYQSGIDKSVKYSGAASAFLSSNNKSKRGKSATLMQIINSSPYKGKRIRLSAWIKTRNGMAALWLETNLIENSSLPGGGARFIFNNTDWKQYSLVVDADTASPYIEFGIILTDTGKVWIDEVNIETVDTSVPLTASLNNKKLSSSNLSFEDIASASNMPDYWSSTDNIDYEFASDHAIFHDGSASASLKFTGYNRKPKFKYGAIMGNMHPDGFAGKRVRMTAWIKTQNVSKKA